MKDKMVIIVSCALVIGLLVFGVLVSGKKDDAKKESNESSQVASSSSILENATEEDIKIDQDKLNIYMFWGDGCVHCKHLKEFFSGIDKEYGQYYKLYAFEVWGSEDNKKLMDRIGGAVGEDPNGVPFLVVGDQTFSGYSETMDKEIKKAIKDQFKKTKRFDAYQKLIKK